jgi:hypothetical protein
MNLVVGISSIFEPRAKLLPSAAAAAPIITVSSGGSSILAGTLHPSPGGCYGTVLPRIRGMD